MSEKTKTSVLREYHSTETLLIRVINDILRTDGSGDGPILVLLDWIAAVDTVDHNILIEGQQKYFCFYWWPCLPSFFVHCGAPQL